MTLGRIVGTVVATQKHGALAGHKLMIVQPVDPGGGALGSRLVALDTVQAGVGDTVLVCDEGNSARTILGDKMAPIRTMIVGIVDEIVVDWPRAGHRVDGGPG